MCFLSNFLDPWQETFADAGDGDGGEGGPLGTIWEHFKSILSQFCIHCFFRFFEKSTNIFLIMFIYTENDIESHRNIQNINI